MRTRDEHLAWCKERALVYWRSGKLTDAVVSMLSDLGKHPETAMASSTIGAFGVLMAANNDSSGVYYFITGFR